MSKNDNILQVLRQRLDSGLYPEGSKFPSEYTLADEFSVNKVTINKVVSMLCSEGRLQRGVRGSGTRVTGAKAPFLFAFLAPTNSRYNDRVIQGVLDECEKLNALVFIENARTTEFEHRIDLLKKQGVNGFIGIGRSYFPNITPLPFIWVDCNLVPLPEMDNCLFINSDNGEGARQMMEAIIERGHREILIFSLARYCLRRDNPATYRLQGFMNVMEKHGIQNISDRVIYGSTDDDAAHFLSVLLDKFPHTTLIVTDSDSGADLLHKASLKLKINIPGDIALAGFGNITNLPIATVEQQPERQGALAVRALVKACLDRQTFSGGLELVPPKLYGLENIPILR